MSRRYTGFSPSRIGMLSNWAASLTIEFTGTIGYLSPIGTLPDGLIALPFVTAMTTSSGAMPYDFSLCGSTVMTNDRAPAPNGGGAETPGKLANVGRTENKARSLISAT